MGLLEGKVAIITGAARGIGYAVAQRFVEEGATVVVADLDEPATAAAADALGDAAVGCTADITRAEDVAAMFDRATTEFGSVDILVNNAGITRDATIHKMALADFRAVIDVHLQGTWLGMKEAITRMRDRTDADGAPQGGAIVNMSSISGKVGNFGQSNYAAAKAGIIGMTKTAAREGGRYGIRVNAIQPGMINTDMTAAMPEDVFDAQVKTIPLGRAGEPEEIAGVATFLCSDLASYVTGVTIEVAGGRHM